MCVSALWWPGDQGVPFLCTISAGTLPQSHPPQPSVGHSRRRWVKNGEVLVLTRDTARGLLMMSNQQPCSHTAASSDCSCEGDLLHCSTKLVSVCRMPDDSLCFLAAKRMWCWISEEVQQRWSWSPTLHAEQKDEQKRTNRTSKLVCWRNKDEWYYVIKSYYCTIQAAGFSYVPETGF